jgi:hypothetical protein
MPVTSTPIFAQTPFGITNAVSATANTSRSKSAAAVPTNGVLITPNTNTNGIRLDKISLIGNGTTLAGVVIIWAYDGTDAYVFDEFVVTVVTPSTTASGFTTSKTYDSVIFGPNFKLYATSTVASQLVNVAAFGGAY